LRKLGAPLVVKFAHLDSVSTRYSVRIEAKTQSYQSHQIIFLVHFHATQGTVCKTASATYLVWAEARRLLADQRKKPRVVD
jgi:hypothetical protein